MFKHPLIVVTMGLIVAIASQAFGQVPGGTKIGTLNCQLAPSVGFIIGSHDPMRCRYTPDGPFPPEFYEGVINTIGLDIGFKSGGEMAWAVVAPTVGPPPRRACRRLRRRERKRHGWGRRRGERPGRRLGALVCSAAPIGAGPGRPRSHARRERPRTPMGAVTLHAQ